MLLKYFLTKLVNKNIPHINNQYCIHSKGKGNICDQCKENCPEKAISVKDKKVLVDGNLCNGCGVCRAICPAQSIEFSHFDERNGLKKVEKCEVIIIGCNGEGNLGNINFICLNGLHKEYLIALLLTLNGKKAYFILSGCENCEIAKDGRYFKESLISALGFVNDLGIIPQVSLVYSQKDIPRYIETMSRRELFGQIKGQSKSIVNEVANDIKSIKQPNKPRDFLIESIMPLIKQESIKIYKKGWILTNWQVSSKCNGCALCEAICPQKAWRVEKKEEFVKIYNDAGRCTSCGICSSICPQGALTKGVFSTDLLKGFDNKLEIALNLCKECNKRYIPSQKDAGYCSICDKRRKIRQSVLKGI